jgi:hypothetical protein
MEFFAGDTKIGEKADSPYTFTWSTSTRGSYTLTTRATDIQGRVLTSAPVEVLVGYSSEAITFVNRGSTWRYLDNGSDQGAAWRAPSFNDASWASGPAQLGYGDGDESTTVSFGPSSGNKYITTYFRHSFNLAEGAVAQSLNLHLLRDDGAVVYLNGTEVFRDNLPATPITYLTPANNAVGGSDESTFFLALVDPQLLVSGPNVLAVEVHQNGGASSDLSFDLELSGATLLPQLAPPTLTIRRVNDVSLELAWPAEYEDWFVYHSASVDSDASWFILVAPVNVVNGENVVTLPSATNTRFFRLQK